MKRLNWTDAKETLFIEFTHNEDEQSARAELDEVWGIRNHKDYYRHCGVWTIRPHEKEDVIDLGKSIQRTFPKVWEAYKDSITHKADYVQFVQDLVNHKVTDTVMYGHSTSYWTADMVLLTYL